MLVYKTGLLFKLLFIATFMLSSVSVCFAQPVQVEYSVLREISLSEYGYALYNDTYSLERSALDWIKTSEGKWFVGFPSECGENLGNFPLYPAAYTSSHKYLNISKVKEGRLVWFVIDLSPVISDPVDNLTLYFEIFLTNIILTNESLSSNLVFSIVDQSAYKIQGGPSTTKITVSNETYFEYLPRFFSYLEGSNKTIVEQSAITYLEPISCKVKVVAKKLPGVVSRTLYKRLKLDQFLNLYAEDGYSLNFKNYMQEEITVTLPFGAHEIKTRDLTGPLEHTLKEDVNSSKIFLSVKPRYGIYQTLYGYNTNYTFFVSYKLDASSSMKRSGDSFILSLDLIDSFYNFSQTTRIEIQLPLGAILNKLSLNNFTLSDLKKGDGFDYFEISNATSFILKGTLSAEFSYSLLWAGYAPSVITLVIGLTTIALIFPLKYTKKGLLEKGIITDSALKEEFIKEYINVLGLHKLLQDLQEDLISGSISRRDYRSKQEVLNNKLNTSTRLLSQLKGRLQGLGSPVIDALKELDILEGELKEARNSLSEIRMLFLNRKISKKSYNELTEKYSREIDDLTNRIIDFLKNL